jgi:sugar transferase EpsL
MEKRLMDLMVAVPLTILVIPAMAVIALLIVCIDRLPVFFCQQRPGWKGQPFVLYKFSTMRALRDSGGHLLPDAQRLTRFGAFLRKTSLDELPELLNILRGDMSLIGPRPLLMEYLSRYTAVQARRHEIRPGITGWAQVNGRNAITWEQRFALDIWYIDHHSFRLDMKILALTIWKVLIREGISQPGSVTMDIFLGSAVSPQE